MKKSITLNPENSGSFKFNNYFFSLFLSFHILIIGHKKQPGGNFNLLPGNLLTQMSDSWC